MAKWWYANELSMGVQNWAKRAAGRTAGAFGARRCGMYAAQRGMAALVAAAMAQ